MNPNCELVCCICCGRDTKAKSAICYRCVGQGSGSSQINDSKGRKELSRKVRHDAPNMQPIEDQED